MEGTMEDEGAMNGAEDETFIGWNMTLSELIAETRRLGRRANLGSDNAQARARILGARRAQGAQQAAGRYGGGHPHGALRSEQIAAVSVSAVHDDDDDDDKHKNDGDSDGNSAKRGSDLSTCPSSSAIASPSPQPMAEENSSENLAEGYARWDRGGQCSGDEEEEGGDGKICERLMLVAGKLEQTAPGEPYPETGGGAGPDEMEGSEDEGAAHSRDPPPAGEESPLKKHKQGR